MVFLLVLLGWLFSLTLHEYAHARVAYAGGDYGVKEKGYLSFNPIRYMDPVMSVIIPLVVMLLGGIALPGGLVYVRHDLLRGPGWSAAVSIAGPAANALCAVACAAPFALGVAPESAIGASPVWIAIGYLAYLQVMAVVLNLLPIPSFDGFGVIEPFLPRELRRALFPIRRYGFIAVLLLLFFVQPVGDAIFGLVRSVTEGLGVPIGFVREGQHALKTFGR